MIMTMSVGWPALHDRVQKRSLSLIFNLVVLERDFSGSSSGVSAGHGTATA